MADFTMTNLIEAGCAFYEGKHYLDDPHNDVRFVSSCHIILADGGVPKQVVALEALDGSLDVRHLDDARMCGFFFTTKQDAMATLQTWREKPEARGE